MIDHEYQKVGGFYLPALNRTVTDVRLGGNAVLSMRYDSNELAPGVSEIIAYGTAVVIVPDGQEAGPAEPPASLA